MATWLKVRITGWVIVYSQTGRWPSYYVRSQL